MYREPTVAMVMEWYVRRVKEGRMIGRHEERSEEHTSELQSR